MEKEFLNLENNFWERHPVSFKKFKVYPVWFDSMGAKSSCILIETPETKILVDPGASGMQPAYPLPEEEKSKLREKALKCIKEASKRADIIFISHYHYDHHFLPEEAGEVYKGKTLWIKNPNLWINFSQWKRARLFLKQLLGEKIEKIYTSKTYLPRLKDPLEDLPISSTRNYGSYQERKNELIEKGRDWFFRLYKKWRKEPWISEKKLRKHKILFADGKSFKVGATKIKATPPLFHGIEYDRLGWVTALVVERAGIKLLYTSDLQGPVIEDYAFWIAKERPSILILDGPSTYLLGYMLNLINLERCIKNLLYILDHTFPRVFILDHHLLRDIRYRERIDSVYRFAKRKNKKILTAAEWYKKTPLILQIKQHLELKMKDKTV